MVHDGEKLDLNGIFRADKERKKEKEERRKVITFRDYLQLVSEDPKIAQNSPSRLVEIFDFHGTEPVPEDRRLFAPDSGKEVKEQHLLISRELFGLEVPTHQFVKFLKAGARGLSTGKQIVLLVGPTATGKSTFVSILRRASERYDLRPVFALEGCPRYEEPLHLIPRYMRKQAALKPEECSEYPHCGKKSGKGYPHLHLGVRIEGDLDPFCRHRLLTEFYEDGSINWLDFPIETFGFSEQGRRGIGSFEPSDEKTQDVSAIVGKENLQVTASDGYTVTVRGKRIPHPEAFNLSAGELQIANRGLFEGRELIKANDEILWLFISVAEEKEVKVQGSNLPHLSLDTVVVGHTNLTEFRNFAGNKENEALHDRIFVIPVPYPVRIDDEVKVYRKLINGGSDDDLDTEVLDRCHIAPGSLRLAATFAVLTRLQEDDRVDILTKAKLLNGDRALTALEPDAESMDVREIIQRGFSNSDISKRDGMFGMSSRDVLSAINLELVRQGGEGCLTPLTVIKILREVFEHRMGFTAEEEERFREFLEEGEGTILSEYRELAVEVVKRAFLESYGDLANELYRKYIKNALLAQQVNRKYIRGEPVETDKLGRVKEADVEFLEAVEQFMEGDLSPEVAPFVRSELIQWDAMHEGEKYPALERAVGEHLLTQNKTSLTIVLDSDRPKEEDEKHRVDNLFTNLREEGFCEICSKEIVEDAAKFLSE